MTYAACGRVRESSQKTPKRENDVISRACDDLSLQFETTRSHSTAIKLKPCTRMEMNMRFWAAGRKEGMTEGKAEAKNGRKKKWKRGCVENEGSGDEGKNET